jgi:hypothetical protein
VNNFKVSFEIQSFSGEKTLTIEIV